MYFKKPYLDHFELVAVLRIFVLEQSSADDFEVQMALADGSTLNRFYTRVEYSQLIEHPPEVII